MRLTRRSEIAQVVFEETLELSPQSLSYLAFLIKLQKNLGIFIIVQLIHGLLPTISSVHIYI